MSCILSIVGKQLDADALIAKIGFKEYKIAHKGVPKFQSKPDGDKLSHSSISVIISKAGFDNLKKQIKDTIKFLEKNQEKLRHIALTKEVQYATLDFGIDLRIDRKKVLTQTELLPAALLKLAGNLGLSIELSFYPVDLEIILEKRNSQKSAMK